MSRMRNTPAPALTTELPDPIETLISAGKAAEQRSDFEQALRFYDEAWQALKQSPDPRAADVLRFIGTIYRERGETDRAHLVYNESLERAAKIGYTAGVAHAMNWLAVIAVRRGDLADAEQRFGAAAHLARNCGERRLLGMIEQNLGVLANIRGDLETALTRYRSALAGFLAAGDEEMAASILNNIAMLETDTKQWDAAESNFARALAMAQSLGNVALANSIQLNRVELEAARARWAAVETSSRNAADVARASALRVREAEALRFQGMSAREAGRFDEAERALSRSTALAVDAEDRLLEAQVGRELGEVFFATGRVAEAQATWLRALELFTNIGAALDRRAVQNRLAQLQKAAH